MSVCVGLERADEAITCKHSPCAGDHTHRRRGWMSLRGRVQCRLKRILCYLLINPANIVTRRGDTLADNWPYFDDNDKDNTYEPLLDIDVVK